MPITLNTLTQLLNIKFRKFKYFKAIFRRNKTYSAFRYPFIGGRNRQFKANFLPYWIQKEQLTDWALTELVTSARYLVSFAAVFRDVTQRSPSLIVISYCNVRKMPGRCVVGGCLPSQMCTRKRRQKWVDFVKQELAKWQPTRNSLMCSRHFTEDDYIRRFSFDDEVTNKSLTPRLTRDEIGITAVLSFHAEAVTKNTSGHWKCKA